MKKKILTNKKLGQKKKIKKINKNNKNLDDKKFWTKKQRQKN